MFSFRVGEINELNGLAAPVGIVSNHIVVGNANSRAEAAEKVRRFVELIRTADSMDVTVR